MQQKTEQFLQFSSQPNPRFVTDQQSIYPLTHQLSQTALTDNEVDFLHQQLGDLAPSIIDFYAKINGADLFVGKNHNMELNNTFSFNLFPVHQMTNATEGLLDWIEEEIAEEGFEESHNEIGSCYDGIPPWWSFEEDTALVIASYEWAAEYIFVVLQGEKRGMVYEFDHDGYCFTPLARSFAEFIALLTEDPMRLIGPYMNSYSGSKGGKIIEYLTE